MKPIVRMHGFWTRGAQITCVEIRACSVNGYLFPKEKISVLTQIILQTISEGNK